VSHGEYTTQCSITPPGTLNSLNTHDLRQWAQEIKRARDMPIEHWSDAKSWRKRPTLPSWVLPYNAASGTTRTLHVTKKSWWRGVHYQRQLRVRSDGNGPSEFATVHPRTGLVTNSWSALALSDVITVGKCVYLCLPGGLFRFKTFLEVQMASEEAAAALVTDWGWEAEGSDNPAVLAADSNVPFRFAHGDGGQR